MVKSPHQSNDGPVINPYHPPKHFSRHVEPLEVGGASYWRCKECGTESIYWTEEAMYSAFVHDDGCPVPDSISE